MVDIPANYRPFSAGYEPVFVESARLQQLQQREKAQLPTALGVAAVLGPFGAVLAGVGFGIAHRRTRAAIDRRVAEERAAALERERAKLYEATYGKFDLLQATINAQRQSNVSLMDALRRSQR